ncbi:WD-40 repeat protein [Reticulomyxa filosa]|uniref:WD-40 repeat protein n=1 Tax=Reticulomyxa filosa TaxID=46433 RepID=X6M2T5_RETFI|nr:WD-40 repeat protein [Reticulomyxa filosa]|eukprot:ETO07320.1 WD-40 repeat protein [Reticulomyxa filosa]
MTISFVMCDWHEDNCSKYLCSGSGDKTIHLWDVEISKLLHVFDGHEDCVWCVDISSLQSNKSDGDNKSNSIGVIGEILVTQIQYYLNHMIKVFVCGIFDLVNKFNGHTSWMNVVECLPFVVNNIEVGSRLNVKKSIMEYDILNFYH